jgi:DNA repair protein RadC
MIRNEDAPPYLPTEADPRSTSDSADDATIEKALAILERRLKGHSDRLSYAPVMGSPADVKKYLTLLLSEETIEKFVALFLDAQHRLIKVEVLATGTIDQAVVYPREVAKVALALDASAAIFAHNHPSGSATPSRADITLTEALKAALALFNIRVVDHVIVPRGAPCVSMAETGQL